MVPTIADGDILIVDPLTSLPSIGDIVLFSRGGEFKAHRIISKRSQGFITRGDAGDEPDGMVQEEDLIGRVVAKQCQISGRLVPFGAWHRLQFAFTELRRRAKSLGQK